MCEGFKNVGERGWELYLEMNSRVLVLHTAAKRRVNVSNLLIQMIILKLRMDDIQLNGLYRIFEC